jgi:uncharacterized membrane protein
MILYTPLYKVLLVLSAACFVVGTTFLAKSVRWQAENLPEDSELAKAARKMGSPGRTDVTRLRIGMILNAVGYALVIVSTIISP